MHSQRGIAAAAYLRMLPHVINLSRHRVVTVTGNSILTHSVERSPARMHCYPQHCYTILRLKSSVNTQSVAVQPQHAHAACPRISRNNTSCCVENHTVRL